MLEEFTIEYVRQLNENYKQLALNRELEARKKIQERILEAAQKGQTYIIIRELSLPNRQYFIDKQFIVKCFDDCKVKISW